MAPNAEPLFVETAQYLAEKLGFEAVIAHTVDWEQREQDLDSGQTEIGWICGLPYVWKADAASPGIELLAAPVMSGERYMDQPVYFSDAIVRADSDARTFEDLRGARWAYNEPRSHSGYNVLKAHIFDMGESDGFFASVTMAGSHENALTMILDGSVDGAVIDSTVYETVLREDPALGSKLRVIESLGPSPMPPWIISSRVQAGLRSDIGLALTEMHEEPEGKLILQRHAAARYASVTDVDYDPIREMDAKARQVRLC
jgi:phosphonate transport system substrate-binding protein